MNAKIRLRKPMYTLSIDPGLAGTGWALWETEGGALVGCGNIYNKDAKNLEIKCNAIAKTMFKIMDSTIGMDSITEVYCEYPAVFGGAAGMMVAMKGDIVKLSVFCGYMMGHLNKQFTFIPVNNWKGQLPKPIVIRRIKKICNMTRLSKEPSAHAWDAIGIGLYVQGKF